MFKFQKNSQKDIEEMASLLKQLQDNEVEISIVCEYSYYIIKIKDIS